MRYRETKQSEKDRLKTWPLKADHRFEVSRRVGERKGLEESMLNYGGGLWVSTPEGGKSCSMGEKKQQKTKTVNSDSSLV